MRKLDTTEMEYCERCKELWFDIRRNSDGICQRCLRRDRGIDASQAGIDPSQVFLMTASNNMDPGDLPHHLPELSDMEQMLIAPVHISIVMAHIKGAQWRYKGHVMTFLRDVPDIVTRLPRLPRQCNVVLVRPKQVINDLRRGEMTAQFRRAFTVQRWKVQVFISSQCYFSAFEKELTSFEGLA